MLLAGGGAAHLDFAWPALHVSNIGLGGLGVDVVTCPGLRRAVANAMEAVRARLLGLSLQAREFCEQVGLPLELDTDGIWCLGDSSLAPGVKSGFSALWSGIQLKILETTLCDICV